MHILMIFLDGVGLGDDDPTTNPFAAAHTPTLNLLANGRRWLRETDTQYAQRSTFLPTDPCLGIPGRPQSGTGQAAILTGRNIPQIIGQHYGPKPDRATRELLAEDNFFKQVVSHGKTAALLEAYPPRWHQRVNSGKQLRASFQLAAHEAGLPTFGETELYTGQALAADWTGEGWRTSLGYTDSPVYTPYEAGIRLVKLSRQYDFAFSPNWITDVIGHRGTLAEAIGILKTFDAVMAGVLDTWQDDEGLVIITSDHGNMEDMSHGKHTENDVPTVVIGQDCEAFAEGLRDLTDYVPRMNRLLLHSS